MPSHYKIFTLFAAALILALSCTLKRDKKTQESKVVIADEQDKEEPAEPTTPQLKGVPWTLRFPSHQDYASAQTGCYADANFAYKLPSVDEVIADRERLVAYAASNKLAGAVWTSELAPVEPGHRDYDKVLVVDLIGGKKGRIVPISGEKYLVFCRCQSDSYGAHCTTRDGISPLGKPF